MQANYHTHCDYCDGAASAAAMAQAAFDSGYSILGFSSHAPLGRNIYPGNMRVERLGDYIAEIRALGRAWEDRGLQIPLGLEIDWLRGRSSPASPLFQGLALDYRIGSVHLLDFGDGPFAIDDNRFADHVAARAQGDAALIWKAYYEELSAMIEAGGFDILGHFDLPRKNNASDGGAGLWFDEEDAAYRKAALGAAELLAGKDIVVEINTGAMARGKLATPYPSLFILRELNRLGVPITLSADAHEPGHLGPFIEASRALAKAAGYKALSLLSRGRWTEAAL